MGSCYCKRLSRRKVVLISACLITPSRSHIFFYLLIIYFSKRGTTKYFKYRYELLENAKCPRIFELPKRSRITEYAFFLNYFIFNFNFLNVIKKSKIKSFKKINFLLLFLRKSSNFLLPLCSRKTTSATTQK